MSRNVSMTARGSQENSNTFLLYKASINALLQLFKWQLLKQKPISHLSPCG